MYEVSAVDAIRVVADDEALLLDVREPHEWQAGHAPGAVHIPMNELGSRLNEIPQDAPVLVICHSGGRSALVTEALERLGYEAANVAGGMDAWAAADGSVLTDAGERGTVV